jgi:hypothetical protein
MMQTIKEQDWQTLPESAQQEVYDFFLFLKQRYAKQRQPTNANEIETMAYLNHTVNTIEQWLDDKEDEIWT